MIAFVKIEISHTGTCPFCRAAAFTAAIPSGLHRCPSCASPVQVIRVLEHRFVPLVFEVPPAAEEILDEAQRDHWRDLLSEEERKARAAQAMGEPLAAEAAEWFREYGPTPERPRLIKVFLMPIVMKPFRRSIE